MKVSIKSSSASAALSAAATAAAQSADFEIVDLAAAAFEVVVDGSTLTSASAALKALVGETSGASSWLEWAATTAAAPELAWLAGEAPVLRIMLNVGARHTAPQVAAAAKAAGLDHIVAKIDAAVGSGSLASGGTGISALDVAVATTLYDVLALLFPPAVVGSAYPSYAKWFAAVVSSPAVAPVLRKLNLVTGGVVREGGQIDVRASPVVVAALADRSIALNAGHKKAESQRAAEDAAKAKEGAGAAKSPAAAGAGAAAAPSSSSSAAAPAAPAASAEAIAAQGAANRAFAAQSSDARIAAGEATLSKAGVPYSLLKHAPAMTVDELLAALGPENASGACKNLLVKAKKEKAAGDSRVWLVVALHNTKVDLVDLAKRLGYGKIVIRFADADTLVESTGVVQGHVSPLCLANDAAKQINVAIDAGVLEAGKAGKLFFHPFDNTASAAIDADGLLKLIESTGHAYQVLDFSKPAA